MNEEALKDAYEAFVAQGYTKSIDEFKKLINTNPEALKDSYDVFVSEGYTKSIDEYKKLLGVGAQPIGSEVKKKFALESSSEVGSSELPKSPKQQAPLPQLTQEGFEKAMTKKTSVPTDMSGKPIFDAEKSQETKKIFDQITEENKQLQAEKKKYEDVFDKQLNIKPKVEDSQYLKNRLATINTDLINREEEYVVPELQYQFGDLGFKFEESGATGDWVKVTAPNGKTTEISLDNLFDSKSKAQSEILQKFIKDNAPAKGLFVLEKTMREQDKKFNSQKQVDDSIKVISTELNNLNAKQKQFLAKKSKFDKELKALGPNPDKEALSVLEQQRLALKAEMDALIKEEENIKQKSKKLDAAVGKYSIAKSKQGTWGGGIWNAINEGASSISAGITNLTIDLSTEIAPTGFGMNPKELKNISVDISKKLGFKGPDANQTIEQWKNTLTEDQLDAWEDEVDDYIKKGLKEDLLPAIRIGNREIFGDVDTTKQWSNLKEQDFWGGAILGLSKSLPAMIGGAGPAGWAQRTAQMYGQVSDGLVQEMEQDPDFKDISENEKLAITLPIGIVGSVLEEVGLRNIKGSQGVINKIALNVLGKAGKGVTAKTFRELVENEVDGMLSKGLLTITAAGVAEFETGAAQELAETGFKAVYNEIKGKEMFDSPESTTDLIENVLVSGAQEAVGGFVLGVPTAVSTAFTEKGFLKMDDATFDTFANMANDENMQSAYIATLKDKITRGELTTAEAKDQLNNYRNSVGLFRQLPDGLSTRQKKEAMNLLKEKRDLENYVNGKDPALVVKQKNRIAEINDSLTKLSETDAVQEQSTTEVPVQSETGVSEQVEERVSQPKPEVATEPITQEEEVVTQTIIEALNEPSSVFVYDGKKGQLTTIGQTVVLETPTEIIDLGNVDELSDSTLADFGIQKEEELDFTLNEDNSVIINGKTYLNNYSNPEAAISQDKDGNYSVTLDTENGQKRTFRGQQADQIVYQMKLKNFEQNGTEQDIDAAIELADEAIRIEEEVRQPSAEREGKSVRKGKRKQRTLRQPKEPLTKAEREAIAPVQPAPKIDLGEDIARQVGLPPAPEGLDIVTEREAVAPAPTEPQVVSEQAVEAKPTEKIKGGENLSSTFLNDKQLTFQESFDLANSELKEIEAQERTLSVQKEYEAKIREINGIKELAAKADAESKPTETELSYEETMDKIRKEVEATQKVVDDFNSKNNREYRGKSKKDLESELKEAKDKVFEAHQRISRAEDADAAIKEYNKAKENVSEIEQQIKDLEDFNKVNSLIYDQVDASKKSDYEYKELFDKDPRLAAIQDYKDLIEFLEGRNDEENLESISRYKNYIKILEKDIKDNPVKKKSSNEISQLNKDADYYASEIENIQEEIAIEKSNTKEGLVELRKKVKKEIEEVKKDKSLSRDEKIDKIEEIKYQIENFKEEQESIIEQYKNDLKDAKAELKKIEKKLAKLSGQNNVNELLDLDTKKKDGLNRVLDFLNKIDDSLDMDPNELNDITRVMTVNTAKIIVKTLKTLVNAGITLKEAIDKVAEIHSITPDKIIDALDIISKINENKSEGISEMEAPGYNNLSKEIDNMISNDSTIDEVLDYVQSSDVYKNATDVQRELFVRDVRKRFGLRQKSAPSVAKLFGKIKDVTKITMTEKAALAKQLRDKARGAREAIIEWKKQAKQLTEELDELVRTGKISVKQSSVILKKFAKVNIFSRKSVDRFTDYMVKVINKADYANKLSEARKTLSSIKSLSKDDKKNADLRAIGSEFSKIEPSMVENIEEYNDIASKLKTAIDGSKARGKNVKIVDTVNIDEVSSYIEKTIAEQEEKLQQEKIDEIQDLFGVDASEFSAEEIDAMLESEKDLSKDNEKIVRDTIKKAFDIYSSVIKEMLSTGKDPFTDEDVSFTDKEKNLIERFMGIDINTIKDPKDALRMVDSLINFIQNKSTAGMLKPIADFEAIKDSDKIVKKGIKAIRLRKYFSPKIGRLLGQKTTTLPVLFEKMFKGVNRALDVEEAIGVSDLINNASKAESEGNSIVKQYTKEFYDKKANGESYNSLYNDIERGIFAHVNRNVIGNEERQKNVFDKRKQEVLDTINVLENSGNDSEVELAKVIRKAYDKILDGSESINDVRSKTDAENIKGVEFWINKWDSKYEALSDLAKDFYNKILGRDLGYTPDRIVKLQDKRGDVELEDIQSQFLANTDEILYDKKSGSLMDKQENRNIPKDMYIDFSFDKKNSNAMYDALTDLYTAFDIRKVGTFLKSDNFKKIFPSRKDANIIDKRIKNFVRITRRKTPYSGSELSDVLRYADKLAKLGVTASLASLSQPLKQTVPVMTSTLINAGSLGMGANLNRGYNQWLNNLGYAISNRGADAQVEIESINKLIDRAADMPKEKALKYIQKQQDKLLKAMLSNPDIWIARASFKAYYEQSLKRQGKKSSGIDYTKHEVNKKAADYAQRMVDRQQNISNHALAGDLYTSESDATKVLIKMLAPFSSFRMNQSSRLGSDLTTLEYWNTSTKEDKIIALRSIAGYAVESATFRALQIGMSLAMYNLAILALGGNSDDEEDEKYLKNLLKGTGTSAFLDTFSPIPSADPFFQDALASSIDLAQTFADVPEDEKLQLFSSQEQSALKILGTYGIAPQRAKEIFELGQLAYTGKYKDKYGKEKEISQQDADELKKMIPILFTSSVTGIASPDVASISRSAVKIAKKRDNSIDKEFLKKRNPEKYEELFGKNSKNYEIEQLQKEREKEAKERMAR